LLLVAAAVVLLAVALADFEAVKAILVAVAVWKRRWLCHLVLLTQLRLVMAAQVLPLAALCCKALTV
jgi:hypothetical protein